MTERENELKKALAENGGFDAERATQLAKDTVSQLHGELKKSERFLEIITLISVGLLAFSIEKLTFAAGTKAIVGFGVILLYVLVTLVLAKLWYWIVNTKITLQKDLKLWQLQAATGRPAPTELRELQSVAPRHGRALSRWERAAWVTADVIVALTAVIYVIWHSALTQTVNEYVTLKPNGEGSTVTQISKFDRHNDIECGTQNLKSTFRWLDEHGRELPFFVFTQDGQRRYQARLLDPPLPYEVSLEWLNYTRIEENPEAAVKKGNRWTYQEECQYDAWRTECFVTVELPPGMKLISSEPQPVMWRQWGDTARLEFLATVKSMEPFRCKIVYELPGEADSEKAASAKPSGEAGEK
jgi:hypothetical protein